MALHKQNFGWAPSGRRSRKFKFWTEIVWSQAIQTFKKSGRHDSAYLYRLAAPLVQPFQKKKSRYFLSWWTFFLEIFRVGFTSGYSPWVFFCKRFSDLQICYCKKCSKFFCEKIIFLFFFFLFFFFFSFFSAVQSPKLKILRSDHSEIFFSFDHIYEMLVH